MGSDCSNQSVSDCLLMSFDSTKPGSTLQTTYDMSSCEFVHLRGTVNIDVAEASCCRPVEFVVLHEQQQLWSHVIRTSNEEESFRITFDSPDQISNVTFQVERASQSTWCMLSSALLLGEHSG